MFVRQNQQQFRNSNADVQIFYGSGITSPTRRSWNKPVGVSHVYVMLIGSGGAGDGTTGGGSGAVTVWYGSAQNVPNQLTISVGSGSGTDLLYQTPSGTFVSLLSADAGILTGGAAMTANKFSNMGFFQSVAGQDGSSGAVTASSTTFLSGGGNGSVTSNYGYNTSDSSFFTLQPIIVGIGGAVNRTFTAVGCGGAYNSNSQSQGMALIASW